MELSSSNKDRFVVVGICPHCGRDAAFPSVTSLFEEAYDDNSRLRVAVSQCISCHAYIMPILVLDIYETGIWKYQSHYPIGKPNDQVSKDIPAAIRADFQEARRCRWVDAYNATIEMCRRSLEASCLEQGAKPNLALNDMIDWVHSQGKITTPLKDIAHKIKLGGNRAAHPSDRTLTAEDADAVLEFTHQYFHHVYVMPTLLSKFDYDKPKK